MYQGIDLANSGLSITTLPAVSWVNIREGALPWLWPHDQLWAVARQTNGQIEDHPMMHNTCTVLYIRLQDCACV